MSFDLSRRKFFLWSVFGGVFTGIAFLLGKSRQRIPTHAGTAAPRDFLVLGHTQSILKTESIGCTSSIESHPGKVVLFDLEGLEKVEVDVPMYPHGFALDKHRRMLATSQKYGALASVIDLKTKSVAKVIKSPKSSTFFGHCCFSGRNNEFLVYSANHENGEGQLLIYDSYSFEYLDEMRFSRKIHDVQAIGDESLQFALSGRVSPLCEQIDDPYESQRGAIQTVNLYSRKLSSFQTVVEGGHILSLGNNNYLVCGLKGENSPVSVSLVNLATNSIISIDESIATIDPSVVGEALSSCQVNENVVAITCPDNCKLITWNLKTHFIGVTTTPGPLLGIVSTRINYFLGNLGSSLIEFRFDEILGTVGFSKTIASEVGNGRHLYRFQLAT